MGADQYFGVIDAVLVDKGVPLKVFVSPNVGEIPKIHNEEVFEAYRKMMEERSE